MATVAAAGWAAWAAWITDPVPSQRATSKSPASAGLFLWEGPVSHDIRKLNKHRLEHDIVLCRRSVFRGRIHSGKTSRDRLTVAPEYFAVTSDLLINSSS
jgi:hypothetical protein